MTGDTGSDTNQREAAASATGECPRAVGTRSAGVPRRSRLALVILASLLIPILPFLAVGELPGERWLSALDANALQFGMAAAALLASDVWIPVPSSIVGTLAGARLGWWGGFLWVWTGLMGGNLLGYVSGRWLFARFGPQIGEAPTLAGLLVSRPVPVLAEATTFLAGATRVRIVPFVLACGVGNAIYAMTLTVSGAERMPSGWLGPGLAVPLLLPVAGWVIWRAARKRG